MVCGYPSTKICALAITCGFRAKMTNVAVAGGAHRRIFSHSGKDPQFAWKFWRLQAAAFNSASCVLPPPEFGRAR